ncbi:Pentatricopeptide repeat-containing protein [Heracleum sosnowskyi]|uniref:Pentatricopeptide repeat-containing protein n=1 Tax=Heracleum sosnowskyi TaxID=360622 RepID=A0AAD8IK07_9APIA|nr:Pentatricopeptide repeat-containing protein [Heracleum sosnowskyi]
MEAEAKGGKYTNKGEIEKQSIKKGDTISLKDLLFTRNRDYLVKNNDEHDSTFRNHSLTWKPYIMFCNNISRPNINFLASAKSCRSNLNFCRLLSLGYSRLADSRIVGKDEQCEDECDVDIVIAKWFPITLLLSCFIDLKDDWKSALAVFRWVESNPEYKPLAQSYDMMVDILGKMKQMEKMKALVKEMCLSQMISLSTIAKVMRRFAGAGQWKEAVRTFDELESFGIQKDTESMNLLLDTLCKANKVEQAREVFLKFKLHILLNAHTFNIFIHGWCKVKRVDEAHWTVQEMRGHGCRPCAISYSTIIQSYCHQHIFYKVNEILDEMQAQGCAPNVVTYTTIMCSLANAEKFDEVLKIVDRMKSSGCKPDTLFYNAFIHTLGRVGRVREAIHIFRAEMPNNGVAPNTSTYNSVIAMLCHHAQEQDALNVLKDLETSVCTKPDVQTYYPLLKLCFKTGKTENLKKLLDDMINTHHLSLDLSTYTLLIHGLCRTNKCEWAYLPIKRW